MILAVLCLSSREEKPTHLPMEVRSKVDVDRGLDAQGLALHTLALC